MKSEHGDIEPFSAELGFRDALALYIFFHGREEELAGPVQIFAARVRDYLYGHLSIEDMEQPEKLLSAPSSMP